MFRRIRFFHVVDPVPVWMWTVTAVVAAYAAAVTWIDPSGADSALGALMLWQMLFASRGFARPAAAGHFDPMLVRNGRAWIAAAHFIYVVAPVSAVWVAVGMLEVAGGAGGVRAAEPGRLAAFAFLGAATWALSLGGPRLVTGALWIGGLGALAVTPLGVRLYASVLERPEGVMQAVAAFALTAACPFLMIDAAVPMRAAVTSALAATALLAAMSGMAYIVRRSYPLEPAL